MVTVFSLWNDDAERNQDFLSRGATNGIACGHGAPGSHAVRQTN
jgi:hypothetical protein